MTNKITSESKPQVKNRRSLEWLFSILGALNCIIVVVLFTISQLSQPGGALLDIWPFPLFYFFEITTIGLLPVIAVSLLSTNSKSNWSAVPWICSGILVAFVILGAWTIGFFLIPAMLLFLFVGIFADRRTKGETPLHIIFYVAGGLSQSIFVLLTLLNF
jgi:hypothetical protein